MDPLKREGYLWNLYGYTKLHLWGSHLVSGLFVGVGTLLLVLSVVAPSDLPERIVPRLILLSIACFAGATAVSAGSIFTLVFFRGFQDYYSHSSLRRGDGESENRRDG